MCASNSSAADVTVERSEKGAVVKIDGKLFAEYLTRSGHQPAVWPIIGPTGKAMTRSYPAGPLLAGEMNDHPHHHSLWFTHGDVNGRDFWRSNEESHQNNEIRHREFVTTERPATPAKIVTRNDWIDEGKKVCEDERTLVFGEDEFGRWIDFLVTITASEGRRDVRRNEGRRVRRARECGRSRSTRSRAHTSSTAAARTMTRPGACSPIGSTTTGRSTAKWSASPCSATPITSAIRRAGTPARTACLAANPFGDGEFPKDDSQPKQGAKTIPKGEKLTLHYRVLFHAGNPTEADVAEAYQAFAGQGTGASQ